MASNLPLSAGNTRTATRVSVLSPTRFLTRPRHCMIKAIGSIRSLGWKAELYVLNHEVTTPHFSSADYPAATPKTRTRGWLSPPDQTILEHCIVRTLPLLPNFHCCYLQGGISFLGITPLLCRICFVLSILPLVVQTY